MLYQTKMNSEYSLGIDTSNYKTSVAVVDNSGSIICDYRRLLEVKKGEKGLRQSEALFQHVKALPVLMSQACDSFCGELSAVAYSSRPRSVEGSYMPVFLAGESLGRSLASALKIPAFDFSHQEGHIESVKAFSPFKEKDLFLACHFSGGTCEMLKCSPSGIEIMGGTKDISYGQVIDRAGVAMGYDFPAGEALDKLALRAEGSTELLTKIKVKDVRLNLSGIDTQIKNVLAEGSVKQEDMLVREIFEKLSDSMIGIISQTAAITGIIDVIVTGGVSSSIFMRNRMRGFLENLDINAVFGNVNLSQDNGVGIALLGGNAVWG
ncbi:MAG: hypothetical protein GX663_08880 [Clostridiales bacterium]|nr:hypothetical protein [Clostridiales bacterium]